MPTLTVSEFSCLRDVTFTLAPVNVIIGPQGSGKSVTTKLFYFFSDIANSLIQSAERGETLEDNKRFLAKQFSLWFPPSAWGKGRFNINYAAGDFSVRILRRRVQGRVSDEVSVTFSDWVDKFYRSLRDLFDKSRQDEEENIGKQVKVSFVIDRAFRVRDIANRRLISELGEEYISEQTFIPAGRAFFTSVGRLVAGFEQAGSLDPVTIKFARLFAGIRDRANRRYFARRLDSEVEARRSRFMTKLFGGEIRFENDLEFVKTDDGRKVPFTALSSGQQELLPMWSLIDYLMEIDSLRVERNVRRTRPRELVYIEEPEAHLFPSAQSLLMEFLIGSIASEKNRRSIIITTHSPYIMGKLNVFLKAGNLSRRRKRNQEINEIVPRECWLNSTQLSALAIQDGQLRNLIDEDGLIDGRYLDDVSDDISREFSKLLLIESEI